MSTCEYQLIYRSSGIHRKKPESKAPNQHFQIRLPKTTKNQNEKSERCAAAFTAENRHLLL